MPLYRQAQIFARQGVTLDRSTLCTWVGRACWWLAPLHELVLSTVLTSPKVFADDTTLPVLDPGRGRTKTGRLWCYAVDNRPWRGPGHPAAAYVYSEDRKGEHPATHLKGFRGVLQVDGYAGFGRLVADAGNVSQLAFCWAHARRKFYDIYVATQSPLAGEALRQIAALYEIEDEIRGQPAEERRRVRQQRSRPLVEAMQAWLAETLGRISGRSALAQAIRYALNHWSGLILFLDDGRLELDTNTVERAMRPVALGRKNALFAGSDSGGRHWAIIATLIQSAKLNDVDPLAWLTDVLERIVSGRTKRHELDTLLPWNWKAAKADGNPRHHVASAFDPSPNIPAAAQPAPTTQKPRLIRRSASSCQRIILRLSQAMWGVCNAYVLPANLVAQKHDRRLSEPAAVSQDTWSAPQAVSALSCSLIPGFQ